MTDEAGFYKSVGKEYTSHTFVSYTAKEYVRKGDVSIHTNTVEGFFSIFKRGIYQHCSKKHLHRYLAEFDFCYSNLVALGYSDADRTDNLLKGVVGKRLTYQMIGVRQCQKRQIRKPKRSKAIDSATPCSK